MNNRRDFLKKAGMGLTGLALSQWDDIQGDLFQDKLKSKKAEGVDLGLLENASILGSWGYLNVLSFGADPTGINDSTAAIQAAIEAGYNQVKGVFFPSGTYIISNNLLCEKYWKERGGTGFPRQNHILVGDTSNGNRPVIKLAASAPLFDNPSTPKAMLVFIHYQGDGTKDWTIEELRAFDPVAMTQGTNIPAGGIVNCTADIFDEVLRDIDFDCSGHAGAIGVFYAAAQKSVMFNVKVNAVNAHTGIWGIPGRNCGAVNIEVQGGRTGLKLTSAEAGSIVVGLKLHGQTEQAIVTSDFCPACFVGFEIKMDTAPFIVVSTYTAYTAVGTIAFIDGIFETAASGTLISNTAGKCIYARNVYVKGPASFIKSGSQPVVSGSGTWYRVAEYCSTDQYSQTAPYTSTSKKFNTFSIIDGVKNQQVPVEPVRIVENDALPPADLISKHLYTELPQVSFRDASKTINITQAPYNAVPDARDNWAAIQQAIDDASLDGRVVFIPKGIFLISKSLVLKANTKLTGIGCKRNPVTSSLYSTIQAHSTFQKTDANDALITTVDDPEAGPYLGALNLISTSNVLRHIHWKAGRKSTMTQLSFGGGTVVETTIYFSGNGGGRHYLLEPQTSSYSTTHCHIKTVATTQPLLWYGCNLEAGGTSYTNAHFTDSKNIRIYSVKREGATPTLIIDNCENIALYTNGAMRQSAGTGKGGYFQINGNSNNLLIPLVLVQTIDLAPEGYNEPTLIESLSGQNTVYVTYPDGVSIYKRGEINDNVLYSTYTGVDPEPAVPSPGIYPNPSAGILYISGVAGVLRLKMYDLKGCLLKTWENTGQIDISDQKPGVYLLSIEEKSGRVSRHKIIRK
jgi:hypothetical protein